LNQERRTDRCGESFASSISVPRSVSMIVNVVT
jgi:hypothetical protein